MVSQPDQFLREKDAIKERRGSFSPKGPSSRVSTIMCYLIESIQYFLYQTVNRACTRKYAFLYTVGSLRVHMKLMLQIICLNLELCTSIVL